jgi:hypothetical protein
MVDPTSTERPLSDADLFDLLAKAQQQYDRYLELARSARFVELTTQVESLPPVSDTPLSLTIWPKE